MRKKRERQSGTDQISQQKEETVTIEIPNSHRQVNPICKPVH